MTYNDYIGIKEIYDCLILCPYLQCVTMPLVTINSSYHTVIFNYRTAFSYTSFFCISILGVSVLAFAASSGVVSVVRLLMDAGATAKDGVVSDSLNEF